MKLERYPFLIRVALIDWNSESIFRYELQIAKDRCKRLIIKLRLLRMGKKLEYLRRRPVWVGLW